MHYITQFYFSYSLVQVVCFIKYVSTFHSQKLFLEKNKDYERMLFIFKEDKNYFLAISYAATVTPFFSNPE